MVTQVLILTFCGEYEGVPEFNEDILRCILSFLTVRVVPRLKPSIYNNGFGDHKCSFMISVLPKSFDKKLFSLPGKPKFQVRSNEGTESELFNLSMK